tara:strand:+ start:549 stop:1178 length:630 start_codon:yes stop_codon:yes gene_type:complete
MAIYEKPSDNPLNPLNQKVNEVSNMENPKNYSQMDTVSAMDDINRLYSDAGYSDVGQFMKNMAATESNLGGDKLGDYSFGATQIDPIKYKDIVERATGPEGLKRVGIANKYLSEKLDRPDFDILNLNLQEEAHNPYISAALTRMGLLNIPEAIPGDLEGQAKYWKEHWNTEAGKGTPEHFMDQSRHYFPSNTVNDVMDANSKVEDAFNY